MTLNLAETSVVKSRPSVPYGANLSRILYPVVSLLHARTVARAVSSELLRFYSPKGEYWKYSIRSKRTVLTRSAITPPKVNRFEWNLEQCEPNVGWPWQILGAICAVATFWEGAEFFFVMRITHGFADFPSDKFYIGTHQRRSVSPHYWDDIIELFAIIKGMYDPTCVPRFDFTEC